MTEVGIRPDADRPVETTVKTTTARELERRCVHGRVAWLIGSTKWHRKSDVPGEENLLEPCVVKT